MTTKPKPTHYTTQEGGHWIAWLECYGARYPNSPVAHAIKFSDGSIFDMVNGWRPNEPPALKIEPQRGGLWALEKFELACRRIAIDEVVNITYRMYAERLANELFKLLKESRE